tara:strand:- start:180 stop:677 length:498 start_codon:yes stop_codon:yes gene_type:complete
MIIWLIGLSGSGKTSIAFEIYKKIKNKKNFMIVDGDEVRQIFDKKTKHDKKGRFLNAKRIQSICKLCDNYNINVICNIVCIFPNILKKNRKLFKKYFEVYVESDINYLINRNNKNVYKKKKNVVGMDIKFPIPKNPDMVINTFKEKNKEKNADKIFLKIKKYLNS